MNAHTCALQDTCQQLNFVKSLPLPVDPPFPLENIVVVSNGNCASTCSHFTTLLHEKHNVKMAVFGAKPGEQVEFKGMAGNQVLEWSDVDTEIKSVQLKNVRLEVAPMASWTEYLLARALVNTGLYGAPGPVRGRMLSGVHPADN